MMPYSSEELWFNEHEHGGTQNDHSHAYKKFDPVDHVSAWRAQVLIVHSGHDFRIPEMQGIGAFIALQRRGVSSKLLNFPDESYSWRKPRNSALWHDKVIDWLKQRTDGKSK